MLRTSDLDYELPAERIATAPASPRDSARLMVVRGDSEPEDAVFSDLPGLLAPGDHLVVNTSRVLPARFVGVRDDTGGRVEGLFLGMADASAGGWVGAWLALVRSRRFRVGAAVSLLDRSGSPSGDRVVLVERREDPPGAWVVGVLPATGWADTTAEGVRQGSLELLERVGRPPLPPYIRGARRAAGVGEESAEDAGHYQTVYADGASGAGPAEGSVAAPTAGLHFTPRVLDGLAARGVGRSAVTLHVGAGTFREVQSPTVQGHAMHSEWCRAEPEVMDRLAGVRAAGGRVIAVGTTSCRTLESVSAADAAGRWLETDLLITPGHRWRVVDGLITNFHLPRSTLMALVAARLPGGVEQLLACYRSAIARGYRFYSYGDAMLVLP